jgi:DNA invertase Pin-like site-specific DNA recombinase
MNYDLQFNTNENTDQPEIETAAERQAIGIKKAKQRGVKFGSPRLLDDRHAAQFLADRQSGIKIIGLARKYKISRATVQRYIERWSKKK